MAGQAREGVDRERGGQAGQANPREALQQRQAEAGVNQAVMWARISPPCWSLTHGITTPQPT
jgi:hypothetical protein